LRRKNRCIDFIDSGASVDETHFEKQSAPSSWRFTRRLVLGLGQSGSGLAIRRSYFAENCAGEKAEFAGLNRFGTLQRANPELIVPPERKGPRVFASEGLLECIETPSGKNTVGSDLRRRAWSRPRGRRI